MVAGYPPTMPSYRGTFSDAEVTALILYLETWKADPRTDAPTMASTAAVAVDPACGMQVHAGSDTPHVNHQGRTIRLPLRTLPRPLCRQPRRIRSLTPCSFIP